VCAVQQTSGPLANLSNNANTQCDDGLPADDAEPNGDVTPEVSFLSSISHLLFIVSCCPLISDPVLSIISGFGYS